MKFTKPLNLNLNKTKHNPVIFPPQQSGFFSGISGAFNNIFGSTNSRPAQQRPLQQQQFQQQQFQPQQQQQPFVQQQPAFQPQPAQSFQPAQQTTTFSQPAPAAPQFRPQPAAQPQIIRQPVPAQPSPAQRVTGALSMYIQYTCTV